MNGRNIACLCGAVFIGLSLTSVAAIAKPTFKDVVVEGKRFDPETQRIVSYKDLNLAYRQDQKVLHRRISTTARGLCHDLGHQGDEVWFCKLDAIRSTDDQVAAAIDRAKQKMAGKAVGPEIAISMLVGVR